MYLNHIRINDLEILIAIIFNNSDPKMIKNDGRLISKLLVQSMDGEGITIYINANHVWRFYFWLDR